MGLLGSYSLCSSKGHWLYSQSEESGLGACIIAMQHCCTHAVSSEIQVATYFSIAMTNHTIHTRITVYIHLPESVSFKINLYNY